MNEIDKEAKEFYEDTLQSFEKVILESVIESVESQVDEGEDETAIAMVAALSITDVMGRMIEKAATTSSGDELAQATKNLMVVLIAKLIKEKLRKKKRLDRVENLKKERND